jgi:hypothetical protein
MVNLSCISYLERDKVGDFAETLVLDEHLRLDGCLNTLGSPSTVRRLFQTGGDMPYSLLFAGTSYKELTSASPYIVSLDSRHQFFQGLVDAGERFGFICATLADPHICLRHWQSLLNTSMPDGSVSHFRFYSSQTMERILVASSQQELGWLLGPNAYLLAPSEKEGQWMMAAHPEMMASSRKKASSEQNPAQNIADSYTLINDTWWQTTEVHLAAFADVLNSVFRHNLVQYLWREEGSLAYPAHQEAGSLERFVDAGIIRAQKWGFTEPDHITTLVQLYVRHGFTVDSDPEASRFLREAKKDPDGALSALQHYYLTRSRII